MNHFLVLSLIAVTVALASGFPSTEELCVPLPSCPPKNNVEYTVHVPHEDDCYKFYKCDNGCGYLMECPFAVGHSERLMFNVELEICDWAVNVPNRSCSRNDGRGLVPVVADSLSSTSSAPYDLRALAKECPSTGTIYISHETDCHEYYECDNGEKKLHHCNENLIFNPYVEACDYPSSVDCITTGYVTGPPAQ